MEELRLTQYSHGAGCGCKIAPGVLEEILKSTKQQSFPGLLVGYEHKDDAAVLDLEDGTAIISTTDFFMPIVDDAFDFGRIASVNAISDIYAMGGKPILAIGILGWPIDKISPVWATKIIEGSKFVCTENQIPLAGGHSIDCPEPIFGLAVTGRVDIQHLKKNSDARVGDLIYLTKGLGIGILTTAEKRGVLKAEDRDLAKNSMLKSNRIGANISKFKEVHAMTDVTGFGLCGHLLEMCEASGLSASINYVNIPLIDPAVVKYAKEEIIPGGTIRNWNSYQEKVKISDPDKIKIVADPQTSGGLLIAVEPGFQSKFEDLLNLENMHSKPIGHFEPVQTGSARIRII